jgi:hypothetical protein
LPTAIVTVVPTLYVSIRIFLRTGDLALTVGAGVICPFVVYGVLDTWLDESSRLTRSSWARWSADRSQSRPLLFAIAGALVFIGALTLLWLAGSALLDGY